MASAFSERNWDVATLRVGERHPVDHPVRWRVAQDGWRGRRRNRPAPASLADLSVSGARLVVGAGKAPPVDAVVELELEGETATARVVRVDAGSDGVVNVCGVTFASPPPAFMAVVGSLTGRGELRPDFRD